MTTNMAAALNNAGIKVSITKRVWCWVQDHSGKTAKDIALGLNEDIKKVTATLRDLESRNMVVAKKEYFKHLAGKPGRKNINTYATVGATYSLKPKTFAKPPYPMPLVDVMPYKVEKKSKISLDDLSIKEARELYDQLKDIFG